ncbi:sec-independent protein translocase protein TATB, chloroplastic [Phalaenopsis equestris]|uniref:sec-independent protein translocase protein TATB, chloroplastic n=1 Tax=Phalaenopsis equestris TaxID=78828 RepID=UPI0009E2EE60|nr:sec-independent protein translocase protein TATB, chloroplastic [Phalaenopsis equestris]
MTAALFGAVAPCCCLRLRPVQCLPSPSSVMSSKNQAFHPEGSSSRFGLRVYSPWIGLRHVCQSFPSNCKQLGKKRTSRCMVAYASLFGVGAPEILVIGVVALLVFGPKGLAEVARNLGKTLRSFQPTIRELQEVSREFKSTLEREIGFDEVTNSSNSAYRSRSIFNENQHTTSDPNGKPTAEAPLTATELLEEQPQGISIYSDGKPTAEAPLAATESPEEHPREINSQTSSSSENVGEGSK